MRVCMLQKKNSWRVALFQVAHPEINSQHTKRSRIPNSGIVSCVYELRNPTESEALERREDSGFLDIFSMGK